jgi:hypothetical protein
MVRRMLMPRASAIQRTRTDDDLTMPSPRLLSAAFLSAALALSACDGSGEHNVPDEANQEATGADSLSAGPDVPSTLPPAGTVSPSGPGTSADSAGTGMGQSQGASPGSPNPDNPVHSGVASDSA